MWNRKTSGSICGFAALYMWYIAYQLYPGHNTETTMSPVMSWLFMAFFVAAGIALAMISVKQYRVADKEEKEEKDNESLK